MWLATGSVIDRGTEGARCEVDDRVGRSHRRVERGWIQNRANDELCGGPVEVGGVARREVIERGDRVASQLKRTTEVGTDESGAASNENMHGVPLPKRTFVFHRP